MVPGAQTHASPLLDTRGSPPPEAGYRRPESSRPSFLPIDLVSTVSGFGELGPPPHPPPATPRPIPAGPWIIGNLINSNNSLRNLKENVEV